MQACGLHNQGPTIHAASARQQPAHHVAGQHIRCTGLLPAACTSTSCGWKIQEPGARLLGPALSPLWQCRRQSPRLVCQAGKGDEADDKSKKADFSAYWSMKVREFFSSRKQYLEGGTEQLDKRPELLKRLEVAVREEQAKAKELQEAAQAAGDGPEVLEKEAEAAAAQLLRPVDMQLLGQPLPPQPPPGPAELEAQKLRRALAPPGVPGLVLPVYRAQHLLQALLMAPVTLLASAFTAWRNLFNSQRYEMFLMSEGERIWYWRNRTENERWFWEIFAWDRLIFPLICTIAYEYVVPNNLIWAVVVPAVFIAWQTGSLPGPFNMEFWLIAYFGAYKKCWPDVASLLSAVFVWA